MSNLKLAETIVNQMGGQRLLKLMVGARDWEVDENGLGFRFSMCKHTNFCRITYDYGQDLYIMEFLKKPKSHFSMETLEFTKPTEKVVKRIDGVYCDMLMPFFEEQTGLTLRMPRFASIH